MRRFDNRLNLIREYCRVLDRVSWTGSTQESPAGVAELVGQRPAKRKVRAHTWVAGSVHSQGAYKRQQINVSHTDVSLPLFLPPFPSF